jgi:CHASE2 domain-containing sensor protein
MNWQFPNGMTRLVTAWRHWLPGSVAAIVAAILFLLGVLQPLELQVSNTLFRWRGNIPWDPRIVVVAIDDTSLAELGEFPLSRQVYARLLYQLTDAQAAIVVFMSLTLYSPKQPQMTKFWQKRCYKMGVWC